MPAFLAGLAALLILVFGARLLASANPQKLAVGMRMAGGILLLLVAAFLLARGAFPLAIPVAFFGLALLGLPVRSWFGSGGPFASRKSPGQKSEVRTDALEMVLDHDSGEMEGRCLKGQFAGRMLSSLSEAELLVLLEELRRNGRPRRCPDRGLSRPARRKAGAKGGRRRLPRSRRGRRAADESACRGKRPTRCSGLRRGRARTRSVPRIAS